MHSILQGRRTTQERRKIIAALFNNAVAGSHVSISVNEFQFAQLTSFSGRKGGREVGLVLPEGVEGIRLQRGPMNGGHYAVLRIFYKASKLEVKKGKSFEETVKLTLTEYGYKPWTIEKIRVSLSMDTYPMPQVKGLWQVFLPVSPAP